MKMFLKPIEPNFESELTSKIVLGAFPAFRADDLSECKLELLISFEVFLKRLYLQASVAGYLG